MQDTIIIIIVLAILVLALLRAKKHFKGGGCCGSGGNTIRIRKELSGTILYDVTLRIEGMTCENCEIRVENALIRLEHVAARESWKKGCATVAVDAPVSRDVLTETIEKLGYKVTGIEY